MCTQGTVKRHPSARPAYEAPLDWVMVPRLRPRSPSYFPYATAPISSSTNVRKTYVQVSPKLTVFLRVVQFYISDLADDCGDGVEILLYQWVIGVI